MTFLPLESASHLFKQWTHLRYFDLPADSLHLEKSDFDSVAPSKFALAFKKEFDEKARRGFVTTNPFTIAAQVTFWIDWYLERFQRLKHGWMTCGIAWQDLPLRVRRRVNDILEMRAKKVEAGQWPITEEIRERYRKQGKKASYETSYGNVRREADPARSEG